MSQRFNTVMIDDIQHTHCTEAEQAALLDAFEYTVKSMATTLAKQAWFELKDYATSSRRGIAQFTLMLERKEVLGQTQWHGVFEHGNKTLAVMAVLEKR